MFSGGEFCCSFLYACGSTISNNIYNTCCCSGCSKKDSPYQQLKVYEDELQCKDLQGQVAIVTGANTGIGQVTARRLAELGATVILACRNQTNGQTAAEEINNSLQKGGSKVGNAVAMQLDLSDFTSIQRFAAEVKANYVHIDILVNNAGSNQDGFMESLGLQTLFQVNYLGHFYLFHELQDLLRVKVPERPKQASRVINLSSVMHHMGQTDFERSSKNQFTKDMEKKFSYYSDTKLFMNFFTSYINKQTTGEQKRSILALSVNPGAVKSSIWRHLPCKGFFDMIMDCFFLNVEDGAKTTLHACTVGEEQIRSYQVTYSGNENLFGKMIFRPDIPYLTPYHSSGHLHEEIMGSFHVPDFRPISYPSTPLDSAGEYTAFSVQPFIDYSLQLCNTYVQAPIKIELNE